MCQWDTDAPARPQAGSRSPTAPSESRLGRRVCHTKLPCQLLNYSHTCTVSEKILTEIRTTDRRTDRHK